ncbi:MAG: fumarylacetoacetate hydrolase family protein [Spirochaetales bacterium]|nr:fumarylacetoacetate hydrolase family protein [Spirochaetales bacterium]
MIKLEIKNHHDTYTVNPSKIIALGLNYRDHIAESRSVKVRGFDPVEPEEPIIFAKTPNCLIAPGEPIVIPSFIDEYGFEDPRVDHEAELAFIIGTKCKNVPEDGAMEVIYGFTCMNDVSQRNIQTGDRSGWFRGKSFDTFGPIGPVIVLKDEIGDPQNLSIQCRLNGKTVQSSNTKMMIFDIRTTVAFVSKNFTLYPGDIITTGTPSGVSKIAHGDVVEVEIENIGILSNPVVEEGKIR